MSRPGTSVRGPSWETPRSVVPRVLLEHPDPRARQRIRGLLELNGYDVLTCAGPTVSSHAATCPVLRGETCPGADGADVVVSGLPITEPVNRGVVMAFAADPHRRLVLEATDLAATELGDAPVDVRMSDLSDDVLLLEAVAALVGRPRA